MHKDMAKISCARPACRCPKAWSPRASRRPSAIWCRRLMSSSRWRKARVSASSSSPRGRSIRRRSFSARTGRSAMWYFASLHPGQGTHLRRHGRPGAGVIEIVPTVRFYDYEAKYAAGGSKHRAAGAVSPIVYQEVRRLASSAHSCARLPGGEPGRFPLRRPRRGDGGPLCLEVNTHPGMTETSLVPELAAHAGITFDELVQWMVEDASLNR